MLRLILAMLSMAAWSQIAWAQPWSDKLVRVVVPFAPGGATDVTARLVTDAMGRDLGIAFVVENRAGAGGNIGMQEVVRSAPDGATILVMNDAIASNPHYFKLNFDPVQDLVPVIQLVRQPVVLAATPGLGIGSLDELVTSASRRTDLSYGTAGVGSQHHIVGALFAKRAGINLAHVPYRGGGVAVNDLVAGHLPLAILASTPFMPLAKADLVRLLAQSSGTRAPSLPHVPTFKECGFSDIVIDQWTGIFVPKATPRDIIERIRAAAAKALADPMVIQKLEELAVEVVGGTSENFERAFSADFALYGRLIDELGLKPQQ